MPRLEELQYYLHGIWMLLLGRLDGFKWLDFSERGFWRSWWAIVYCLPPMALSWAGTRMYYLSSMPEGAKAGALFVFKLAAVDVAIWIASYAALAIVMSLSGYAARIAPLIIAINWLAVPIQWLATPLSLIQILAPLNVELLASAALPFFMVHLVAHFLLIRRFVDGRVLAAAALLLAMVVVSFWMSFAASDLFGVAGS